MPVDEDLKEEWEQLLKACNSLMVANGAGIVSCLTLFKDYKDSPQLAGLGQFVGIFGLGLLTAILSTAWLVLCRQQLLEPDAPPWLHRLSLSLSGVSTGLLCGAIFLTMLKFWTF